jgi:FAD:protein FMN transferase
MLRELSRQDNLMKTTVAITAVYDPDQFSTVSVAEKMETAFAEFHRVVKQYTRFEPTSELSVLNQHSGEWWEVNPEFYELTKFMLELAEQTGGVYDPTIIDILEAYGYDPKYDFSKLEDPELEAKIQKLVETRPSYKQIELKDGKVKLMPGQRLELGGIGKGYAIDLAYEKLKEIGSFMIDAGGDIRVLGTNVEGGKWRIGLKHKFMLPEKDADGNPMFEERVFGAIHSNDLAVASSGSWARRVGKFHHILNPATGQPSDTYATVFTAAPTALLADAWATPLFIAGTELIKNAPKNISAMWVKADGEAEVSEEFPEFQ